jgi:sortase (surface protein transpeptidase)
MWLLGSDPKTTQAAPPVPTGSAPPLARHAADRLPIIGVGPARATPTSGAGVPVRLRIPKINVDVALASLSLGAHGTLNAPPQWDVPGWYSGGPRPGEPGPAVIAGHVDSTSGPAVFFLLSRLRRGDVVYVSDRVGRIRRFVVDDIRSFPKNRFPTAFVYGPQPAPVLRLITCTGAFDSARHSYVDNLVVSAHLSR